MGIATTTKKTTAAAGAPAQAKTAAPSEGVRFASSKTSTMIQTGLFNDAWAAGWLRYGIRKYEKGPKAGQFYLAVVLTLQPDDPELQPKPEYMRAGDLSQWVPCDAEGNLPEGLTLEDFFALGKGEVNYEGPEAVVGTHVRPGLVGTQTGLPLGTKWNQFCEAFERAGREIDIDLSEHDGVRAFWHRAVFKTKGTDLVLDEGQRQPEVLVPTDFEETGAPKAAAREGRGSVKGVGGAKPASATASAPKPAGAVAPVASNTPVATAPKPVAATAAAAAKPKAAGVKAAPAVPIADRVADALVRVIAAAGGAVNRMEIGPEVMKQLPPAEGAKGVKILSDQTFLTAREEFNYDPESDVLLLPGYAVDEGGNIVQVDDDGNIVGGSGEEEEVAEE